MTTKEILNLVLMLSPVILIQVGMVIYALIDLAGRARTRGPRWAWALNAVEYIPHTIFVGCRPIHSLL